MRRRQSARTRGLTGAVALTAWLALVWMGTLTAQSTSPGPASDNLFWDNAGNPDHFIIMRHALAPGTGDPVGFEVSDCATQRNLDEAGQRQARETGLLLKRQGLNEARVFSSAWCRCLETARLLDLGEVKIQPALNSFFQKFERRQAQTEALRDWLSNVLPGSDFTPILVTHQVNITALTGVYPASGEMILLRMAGQGEVEVVARVKVDPR